MDIPEYLVDWRGSKVYPGDIIIWAGSGTDSMSEGVVAGFSFHGDKTYDLRIDVQCIRKQWGSPSGKLSHIKGKGGSFTKIPNTFGWEVL